MIDGLKQLYSLDPEASWRAEDVDSDTGPTEHFREYLKAVLDIMALSVKADHGYIAISGIELGGFAPFVALNRDINEIRDKLHGRGRTLVQQYLHLPDPYHLIDYPAKFPSYAGNSNIRQKLLLKLRSHGELFGLISLDIEEPRTFAPEAVAALADQLEEVSYRIAEQNFSMRVRQMATPLAVDPEIGDFSTLYEDITSRTLTCFAADGAVLRIFDPLTRLLKVDWWAGELTDTLFKDRAESEGLCGRVFVSRTHSWAFGVWDEEGRAEYKGVDVPEEVLSPLRVAKIKAFMLMRLDAVGSVEDARIGTLSIFYRRPHRFSFRDVVLFRAYAQRVADTIALQRQNQALQEKTVFLELQMRNQAQTEIVALIAHDVLHKSFNAYTLTKDYVTESQKQLENPATGKKREQLLIRGTEASDAVLAVQKNLEQLRSIQTRDADEFLKRSRFTISDVIAEIEKAFRGALSRNHIVIDKKTIERIDIEGPRAVLQLVLFNLVVNSIDAMRAKKIKGAIHISVSRVQAGAHERAEIDIWDDGPGIDPMFKNPAEIFQLGKTSKKEGSGTGLTLAGLMLSRHFQGQIALEDRKTAKFKLTIPL
ncbi:MAG TPA: HAMP domain-containing sensor histidine kinase [Tepidisphaeraceae bacterium]|nr:HAMP domain-containing sensor histidine kinase [Tepidisphaeraceae bacterium]